jgi:hypothetical protein
VEESVFELYMIFTESIFCEIQINLCRKIFSI